MYVVDIRFKAPLAEIDRLLPAHTEWLEKYYATGLFLASGRRNPVTGCIVLARYVARDELAEILEDEPFMAAGVAAHDVIAFTPGMAAPELQDLVTDEAL